jgi:hypothetical protein
VVFILIPNNLRRANFMNPPILFTQHCSSNDLKPESINQCFHFQGTIRNMRRELCVNVNSQTGSSDMQLSQAHDLCDERFEAGGLEEA